MPTPTTVVLFGATGDLARRKLLPGLLHLFETGLMPELQVVGTSLDEHDRDSFVELRPTGDRRSTAATGPTPRGWQEFAKRLHWAPGAERRRRHCVRRSRRPRREFGAQELRRLHYLSVPPKAALPVVHTAAGTPTWSSAAGSSWRSRSAPTWRRARDLNASCTRSSTRSRSSGSTTSSARRRRQNILAFRFANGLFEPIWHRNHIDHVQIDVPEELGLDQRADFYESTGAYRDMVVTHLFQVLAFTAMEPPTALEPDAISEEKNKVFRSMLPIEPVRRRPRSVQRLPRHRGRRRTSRRPRPSSR